MRTPYLALGALLLLAAGAIALEARALSYSSALGPGPGFFPMWLAGLLALLSVVLIVHAWRRVPAALPADFLPGRQESGRLLLVVATLAVATLAIETVGFCLTMLAVYVVVLYGLGRRDWVASPAIALLGSFGAYHVFTRWLGVSLPHGWLGW